MTAPAVTYPLSRRQRYRDACGYERVCAQCNQAEGICGPLVISADGMRIGLPHFIYLRQDVHFGRPYSDPPGEER